LLSTSKKIEEGNMRIDWTRWTVEDHETTVEEENNRKPMTQQQTTTTDERTEQQPLAAEGEQAGQALKDGVKQELVSSSVGDFLNCVIF
jgi:hypothetical protein